VTDNKALAKELHDTLKAEQWRVSKLGERPTRTWNEAVVRWLKESGHKASLETDKSHLRWLDVSQTAVTDAGVREFAKRLPKCKVER
jgi:hypothetical protein